MNHPEPPTSWQAAIVFFSAAIAIVLSIWVVKSKLEAQSYNAITGAHVSTWQAMFVELRVQGQPR